MDFDTVEFEEDYRYCHTFTNYDNCSFHYLFISLSEYEDKIEKHPKWEDTCYHPRDVVEFNDCSSATGSAAKLLRDALGGWDSPQMTTIGIKTLVHQFLGGSPALAGLFDPMVKEGLALNASDMKSKHYRALFNFGLPFPTKIEERTAIQEVQKGNETVNESVVVGYDKESKYSSGWDNIHEQRSEYYFNDYLWDFYRDWDYEHNGDMVDGNLKINSFTQGLWGDFFVCFFLYVSYVLTHIISYVLYRIGTICTRQSRCSFWCRQSPRCMRPTTLEGMS